MIEVNSLPVQVLQNKKDIAELKSNTNDVNSLKEQVSLNSEDISNLKSRVGTCESDIEKNNTTISAYGADIITLKSDSAVNKSNIDINKGDISNLKSRVGTCESNISKNSESITTLKTDVDTNKSNIDRNNGDISNLKSRVGICESNINSLTTRMTTAESNITALQQGGGGGSGGGFTWKKIVDNVTTNSFNKIEGGLEWSSESIFKSNTHYLFELSGTVLLGDFIPKPFNINYIFECVEGHIYSNSSAFISSINGDSITLLLSNLLTECLMMYFQNLNGYSLSVTLTVDGYSISESRYETTMTSIEDIKLNIYEL